MSMINYFLTIGLLLLVGIANAQDEVPKKYIRLLALGELHRWDPYGVNEKGVIIQKPIPKGAQPPNALRYSSGEEVKPLGIPLRQFTGFITLNGEEESLTLKSIDSDGGGEFLKSPAPVSGVNLGVLIPNLKTMDWTDPKILMLKDDAKSFPVGQIRFVNVSDRTITVSIEGYLDFSIQPGQTVLKALKDEGTHTNSKFIQPVDGRSFMRVSFKSSKNIEQEIYSNNLNINEDTRIQCFFYKSKGEGSSKEVRFSLIPETVPTLPKPPKRGR